MALHPDVVAELEAASSARRASSAEVPARINVLESRVVSLEARRDNGNIYADEKFWREVTAEIRAFVEGHINKLKAENAALAARIKCLEDRPPLKILRRLGGWQDVPRKFAGNKKRLAMDRKADHCGLSGRRRRARVMAALRKAWSRRKGRQQRC